MRNVTIAGIIGLLPLGVALESSAQEPFDNVAPPPGSYVGLYPIFSRADRLMDANGNSLPVDPELRLDQVLLKYTFVDNTLLPHTTLLSVFVPVGKLELLHDSDTGTGDLGAAAGYWFIEDTTARNWLGGKLSISAPTGSYDKNRAANMGTNVWSFQPQVLAATRTGDFQMEIQGKYTTYSKNADTGVRQGDNLGLDLYCGYYLSPTMVLGGHVNGTIGEDRTENGTRIPDSGVKKWQGGASMYKRFSPMFSTLMMVTSDFGVENTTDGYTVLLKASWRL